MLAIFPQVASVGIDHGGGVEVEPGHLLLVHRNDDGHVVPGGKLLHQADRGTVGDRLRQFIPAGILLGAEVGAVKQLLQTQNLDLLPGRLLDHLHMLPDHGFADLGQRVLGAQDIARLNQATANHS